MLDSLKSRLIFFSIFILVTVLAGTVLLSSNFLSKKTIIETNDQIKDFALSSGWIIVNGYRQYYSEDYDKFRDLVGQTIRLKPNKTIDNVQLVDVEGKILFSSNQAEKIDPKTANNINESLLPCIRSSRPGFIYANSKNGEYNCEFLTQVSNDQSQAQIMIMPFLESGGFHQYSLVYYLNYEYPSQNVNKFLAQASSYVGTFYGAIFLFFVFAIYFLLNPLSSAAKGVKIINQGNLDYRIKTGGGKEIDLIALAFNKMAQDLKLALQKVETIGSLETELARGKKELDNQFKDLQKKSQELEELRTALLNLSEDAENSRTQAITERDKTMAIINNFADALLVFSRSGKLEIVNPLAERFFSFNASQVIGQESRDLLINPGIRPLVELVGLNLDQEIYRKELILKENLVLEVSLVFVRDKNKEILERVIVVHDITREKMIDKTKSEFVSIAAHQLRTPLSAIKWIFGMMAEGDWGKVSDQQKEYLQKGYISSERLIKIVNDLLNVSRIEEGRFIKKPSFTDLSKLISVLYDQHQGLAAGRHIKLVYEKPAAKLPDVYIDEEQIKLAVENLIQNAINYTPENGTVTISLKENKEDKDVEIMVKDSGIGIPPEQQQRIFTKFFRSTNAIRVQTSGSGMGLFVTKNIIESHNGKVWFESQEGKGTTFHITLPTAAKEKMES